jgi:general secretion pathway protein G
MEKKLKYRYKKSAFTLVELLVVIIIIGLLASIVAPKFFGKLDNAKVKTVEAQLELISTALDTFKLDVGRYPSTQEGLKALWKNNNIKNWNGKYLPKPLKADPWGNPYYYKNPGSDGNEYDLMSLGSDGKLGGTDKDEDISFWN